MNKKRNYAIEQLNSTDEDKNQFMLNSMVGNRAYLEAVKKLDSEEEKTNSEEEKPTLVPDL